jgi:hypothetical protein
MTDRLPSSGASRAVLGVLSMDDESLPGFVQHSLTDRLSHDGKPSRVMDCLRRLIVR